MRNKVNFDTSNKPFSEIIGNSKQYTVPKYQRDYSWDEEQWDELWQDILAIHHEVPEDREEHYMGYLVLQKQEINQFKIIDGQQRLTTLSLLILASLQILEASEAAKDQERSRLIKSNYISTKSPSSLTETFKLELNRNNDAYYRNDLASLSRQPRQRNLKKTEHQMRKAKEFYQKEIKKLDFDEQGLSLFIENIIANYLLFTVITVGDDVNAYKIFETLNARGVHLSTPDLLKNYLFSIIDPAYDNKKDIETQEEKWSITLDNLGKEDFSKFLRCFWNSRHTLATKTNLFKKIKTTYTTQNEAVGVLDDLRTTSSIYAALTKQDDDQWRDISNTRNKENITHCLLALDVFNIVQPYPVLLSAYMSYSKSDFARVCKWVHAFCIRYQVICGLSSRDVEGLYNQTAKAIYEGKSITEIKQKLQSMLPDDEKFKDAFAQKTLPTAQNQKKAHYLLASMENYLSPKNPIGLQTAYSVEHILPKSDADDDYWRAQFSDQLEQYVSRLGNLTLLSTRNNREANQSTFEEKKAIYQSSNLGLLKKLCEYSHWNAESVNDYQDFMAKQAIKIWKID